MGNKAAYRTTGTTSGVLIALDHSDCMATRHRTQEQVRARKSTVYLLVSISHFQVGNNPSKPGLPFTEIKQNRSAMGVSKSNKAVVAELHRLFEKFDCIFGKNCDSIILLSLLKMTEAKVFMHHRVEQVNNRKLPFLNNLAIRNLNHIGGVVAIPLARKMRCDPKSEVYTP